MEFPLHGGHHSIVVLLTISRVRFPLIVFEFPAEENTKLHLLQHFGVVQRAPCNMIWSTGLHSVVRHSNGEKNWIPRAARCLQTNNLVCHLGLWSHFQDCCAWNLINGLHQSFSSFTSSSCFWFTSPIAVNQIVLSNWQCQNIRASSSRSQAEHAFVRIDILY